MRRFLIQKAKPPKKRVTGVTREVKNRYYEMGARLAMSYQAPLSGALKGFRSQVDADKFARALAAGNVVQAADVVPWDVLPKDLRAIRDAVKSGHEAGYALSRQGMPVIIKPALILGTQNLRVAKKIDQLAGLKIQRVTEETRQAVVDMVRRAFDRGIPPRQAADQIRDLIGLTSQQGVAVMNYRDRLERGVLTGLTPKQRHATFRYDPEMTTIDQQERLVNAVDRRGVEDLSRRYADRLLDDRAESIARTEIVDSVFQGQKEVWEQAIDEGLLERRQAQKQWVIDPGTACPEICEPMDGQTVGIDQQFTNGAGEKVDGPTAHPKCNCDVVLTYKGDE